MKLWVKIVLSVGSVFVGAWMMLHYPLSCALLDVDFNLRFNETCSVLQGIDPFLIWKGSVPSENYVPWNFDNLPYYQILPMVHAYPPWAYAIMSPFALFDQESAATMYRGWQLACLALVFSFVWLRMRRQSKSWWWPCVGFAGLCMMASAGFTRCLIVGNYGIVSTAAAFAALALHERGKDEFAGLCWMFALLKPQLGGLFLLTLFLERKWRTLLMTAFGLALATMLIAWQCGRNPMSMVLCVGECGLGQFPGTGLIPVEFYREGIRLMGERMVLACSALVGGFVCVCSWVQIRGNPNVWMRFLPAAVLSVVWATWRAHDFSIHLLVAFIAMSMMWRVRGTPLWLLLLLCMAVALRVFVCVNTAWLACCNYASVVLLLFTCMFVRQGDVKATGAQACSHE